MKRREFNRLALGAGVSPLLASRAFAQGPEQSKAAPAEAPPNKINVVIKNTPRTIIPNPFAAKVCRGQATVQYLLDLELSVGI